MKNLITMGGQHQGVFGIPYCPSLSKKSCEYIRRILNHGAYEPLDIFQQIIETKSYLLFFRWVQKEFVQATYWHNPLKEDNYKQFSTFLSDINNEMYINTTYVSNLNMLERYATDLIIHLYKHKLRV